MMSAWAAFAKDPEKGLEKLGWPTYDENKAASVVQLGGPNSGDITFVEPAVVDRNCLMLGRVMGALGGGAGSGLSGMLGGLLGKAPGGTGLPDGMGSGNAPPASTPAAGSGPLKRGVGRKQYRERRVAV